MTQRDLFTNLKIFILFFYFYIPYYHLHLTRIKPKPLLNSRIKTFVSHGAVGFNKKHMQARTTAPRQWMDLPSRPSFLYASVIRDLVGPRWMNTQNWKLLKTHLVLPSSIVGTLICMAAPQSLPHTKMDTHKKKKHLKLRWHIIPRNMNVVLLPEQSIALKTEQNGNGLKIIPQSEEQ